MNNQLIEQKNNVFTKIKNFFKRLFFKKDKNVNEELEINTQYIKEDFEVNTQKSKDRKVLEKKEFMELYEKTKNGEFDLFSLSPEALEKMCVLMKEEIKIIEKNNEIKREKIQMYDSRAVVTE